MRRLSSLCSTVLVVSVSFAESVRTRAVTGLNSKLQSRLRSKSGSRSKATTTTTAKDDSLKNVVDLLAKLKEEVVVEIQKEEESFAAFEVEAKTEKESLDAEKKKQEGEIVKHTGILEKTASELTETSTALDEARSLGAKLDKEKTETGAACDAERKDYEAKDKEYADALKSLDNAKQVLKAKLEEDVESEQKSEQLIQRAEREIAMTATQFGERVRKSHEKQDSEAVSFLQTSKHAGSLQRRMRKVFAKSGLAAMGSDRVMKMLKDLSVRFTDEKNAAMKEGAKASGACRLQLDDLANRITSNTEETQFHEKTLASQEEAYAFSEKAKKKAEGQLSEMKEQIKKQRIAEMSRRDEYAREQNFRREETEMLQQAGDILSGKPVPTVASVSESDTAAEESGEAADEAEESPAAEEAASEETAATPEDAAPLEFLQIRKTITRPVTQKALLEALGVNPKSDVLSLVVDKVRTGGNFDSIRDLIQKLIYRLQGTSKEEAKKQKWCEEQKKSNKEDMEKINDQVEELQSRAEKLETSSEQTSLSVGNSEMRLKEIARERADSEKVRNEESTSNAAAIKDDQEAGEAIARAIETIQNFYNAGPESETATPGEKREGAVSTILELLEHVQSEYASSLAATTEADAEQNRLFTEKMNDLEVESTELTTLVSGLKSNLERMKVQAQETTADLEAANKQLEDVVEAGKAVESECVVNVDEEKSERAKRMKQEIESLKQALEILKKEKSE